MSEKQSPEQMLLKILRVAEILVKAETRNHPSIHNPSEKSVSKSQELSRENTKN